MMNDLRESARQSLFLAAKNSDAQRIMSFDTRRDEGSRKATLGWKGVGTFGFLQFAS